ncbi:MAG: Mo-dependent nitrogenase C-terminal domain-containing protein [Cyanobacteriota bacterium]
MFNSLPIAANLQPENRLLRPGRQWLETIEMDDPKTARLLCLVIPAACPFERDIQLFGHTLFHIPPLCKFNPFYEQFVKLRFRALSFLADECGEYISAYWR